MADTPQLIERRVTEVIDWLVSSDLRTWQAVMEHLQKLDQVAYVRFASVYRQFKDISQFMDEVKGLIKEGEKGKVAKPVKVAPRR